MQSSSQRTDKFLEDIIICNIAGQKQFVTSSYDVVDNLHDYEGTYQAYEFSWLKHCKDNFISFHNMGTTIYMENFILSSVQRKHCNDNGLTIFLTEEPIHSYGNQHNIFLDGTTEIIANRPDFDASPNLNIWSPELESIEIFVRKNNLHNVKVASGIRDKAKVYESYNFDLIRKDPTMNSISYQFGNFKQTIKQTNDFSKHFLCLNWRYSAHRHLVTAYASLLDTKYSWHYVDNINAIQKHCWFNILEHPKLLHGLNTLQVNNIDYEKENIRLQGELSDFTLRPEQAPDMPALFTTAQPSLYVDTFCSIVNFSLFGNPFPCYDEKVLGTIINYRPFIIAAPPFTLELMQDDGFKTFSDWWDESYDKETNNEKRLVKLFNTLEEINSWSIDKCKKVYEEMQDTILHNYNIVNGDLF